MNIVNSFEILSILTLALYSFLVWVLKKSLTSPRNERISRFLLYSVAVLYVSLIFFLCVLKYNIAAEYLDLLLGFASLPILSFVIAVEIPGYVHLSSYDSENLKILKKIRKSLVTVNFNLESSLATLQEIVKNKAEHLENMGVLDSVQYLTMSIERTKNTDRTLLVSTINEINWVIRDISQQSKHPFPKLIDIFSLTGLSFLLAQILKLLD